jgi:hypothetical protein
MSTLDAQTSLYTEDRGFQVPMTLDLSRGRGLPFIGDTGETRSGVVNGLCGNDMRKIDM